MKLKRKLALKFSKSIGNLLINPAGYIILMYHRLVEDDDFSAEIDKDLSVKVSEFDSQMKHIKN